MAAYKSNFITMCHVCSCSSTRSQVELSELHLETLQTDLYHKKPSQSECKSNSDLDSGNPTMIPVEKMQVYACVCVLDCVPPEYGVYDFVEMDGLSTHL